jgi:hypothetical protein
MLLSYNLFHWCIFRLLILWLLLTWFDPCQTFEEIWICKEILVFAILYFRQVIFGLDCCWWVRCGTLIFRGLYLVAKKGLLLARSECYIHIFNSIYFLLLFFISCCIVNNIIRLYERFVWVISCTPISLIVIIISGQDFHGCPASLDVFENRVYFFDLFFIVKIVIIVLEINGLIWVLFIGRSPHLAMDLDWRDFVSLSCLLAAWLYWMAITFIRLSLLLWIIFNDVNIGNNSHLFAKN